MKLIPEEFNEPGALRKALVLVVILAAIALLYWWLT